MVDTINKRHHKKIYKNKEGKTMEIKAEVFVYAHNGAKFDAYIILQ